MERQPPEKTILPVGVSTSQDANQPASQPVPSPNLVYMSRYATVSSVLLLLLLPFSTSALGQCQLACIGRGEEDELPTTSIRVGHQYSITGVSLSFEPGQCLGCPGKARQGRKLQKCSLFCKCWSFFPILFITILFSIVLLESKGVYSCCIPLAYFVTLHQLFVSP